MRAINGGQWESGPYRLVLRPDHPRANSRGYVREHILIAEVALGRPLPDGVVVHHDDRDGKHNANANLVICPDQGYHLLLHARMRALAACGNANWKRCIHCKRYDDPANMTTGNVSARPNPRHYHPSCNNESARAWRANQHAPHLPESGL